MHTLERTNCAICDSTELDVINEFPNFISDQNQYKSY